MKTVLLLVLFLGCTVGLDDVYELPNGDVIMSYNYFITGIVIPWIFASVCCTISCVLCCVQKKHRQFISVPVTTTTMVTQPPIIATGYGQTVGANAQQPGFVQQPGYGQQLGGQQLVYGQQPGYGLQSPYGLHSPYGHQSGYGQATQVVMSPTIETKNF